MLSLKPKETFDTEDFDGLSEEQSVSDCSEDFPDETDSFYDSGSEILSISDSSETDLAVLEEQRKKVIETLALQEKNINILKWRPSRPAMTRKDAKYRKFRSSNLSPEGEFAIYPLRKSVSYATRVNALLRYITDISDDLNIWPLRIETIREAKLLIFKTIKLFGYKNFFLSGDLVGFRARLFKALRKKPRFGED